VARAGWHKVVHQIPSEAQQLLPYTPAANALLLSQKPEYRQGSSGATVFPKIQKQNPTAW